VLLTGARLVAFVVVVDIDELRVRAERLLLPWSRPDEYVVIDVMPLTENGTCE